jgi:hypothetical protein
MVLPLTVSSLETQNANNMISLGTLHRLRRGLDLEAPNDDNLVGGRSSITQ